MINLKKIVIFVLVFMSAIGLQAKGDLHLFDVDNSDGKITSLTIEDTLSKNGFTIGVRSEMNGPFKKQFKQTDFKSFTLLTIYHTKLSQDLVKKYPDAGVITPMGVGIYQKLNDNRLHLSILTSKLQAKILGIKNNKILKGIEADLLKVIKKAMPKAKHSYSKTAFKEGRKLLTKFELELDPDDDPDDVLDDLEMTLESGFNPYGFIVPASEYYNDVLTKDDTVESPFDFYKTYSICKLEVIYTVARLRPDAAAFAPCTTMVYKIKGDDKVVLGFPAVYNWLSSVRIEDKAAKAVLLKAQTNFESILKEITE